MARRPLGTLTALVLFVLVHQTAIASGPLDPAALVLEPDIQTEFDSILYDRVTQQSIVSCVLTNCGGRPVPGPLCLVVESISTPEVSVAAPDGTTLQGEPYVMVPDVDSLAPSGSASLGIAFLNPNRVRFTLDVRVCSAGEPQFSWSPTTLDRTIGNGQAVTPDQILTVVASAPASQVEFRLSPALAPYIELSPSYLETMEANVPYSVIAHLAIPPYSVAGVYNGIIHPWSGSVEFLGTLDVTLTLDYGDIVIAPAALVLTSATTQHLLGILSDNAILYFAEVTNELLGVAPGDVLVAGVTERTPQGLLRKVVSVQPAGTGLAIQTVQGTLSDVLTRGTIDFTHRLDPSGVAASGFHPALANDPPVPLDPPSTGFFLSVDDIVVYDDDGDAETTGDQIYLDVEFWVDPQIDFSLAVDEALRLHHFRFVQTTSETLDITLHAEVTLLEIEYGDMEEELAQYTMTPITVWAGFVPIVLVPVLTVDLGVAGDLSVGVETSVNQEAELSIGLGYDAGAWVPIADFSNDFSWTPPHFTAGCEAKAYLGPRLNVLIYGVIGPYVSVDGYLKAEVDFLESPWWRLYGGLQAGVGARAEILGQELFDYGIPDLIGYQVLLAQADTTPGTIEGMVRDALTNSPLHEVQIRVFNSGGQVAVGSSDSAGHYAMVIPQGSNYWLQFSKSGYLSVMYFGIDVESGESTHLEVVLQVDESHAGVGSIGGRVLNAVSGVGVIGLDLALRAGINAREGPVLANATTLTNGAYSVADIPAGNYTIQASGSGYITTFFNVVCIGGVMTDGQNATITPDIPAGETRIVLTWGATPADLDSHTTGPLPNGSRFHMYYPYAEANGGSPWPEYVQLDLDDVTSYGPETTTILQQISGVYRFSVHDYTNRQSSTSTALSNSGAVVRVYRGGTLVASYPVPSNRPGTLWTVFEMSGDTLTAVNTMSFATSPGGITLGGDTGKTESSMEVLPLKEYELQPLHEESLPGRAR